MENRYERVMRYASEAVIHGHHETAVSMLQQMKEALVYCNESTQRVMDLNARMGVDGPVQDELHRECVRREFKIEEINGRLQHLGV